MYDLYLLYGIHSQKDSTFHQTVIHIKISWPHLRNAPAQWFGESEMSVF